MPEQATHRPLPITNVRLSTVVVRDEMHFTGGMSGRRCAGPCVIGPLPGETTIRAIGPIADSDIGRTAGALGVLPFGVDQITDNDPNLPARIWHPLFDPPTLKHQPADTWSMIATSAGRSGDMSYAKMARSVSVCFRAAGIQLRNASDEYNKQLFAAIHRGLKARNVLVCGVNRSACPVRKFMSDIDSAHRSYGAVAARRSVHPASVAALNRLVAWVQKSANSKVRDTLLIAALLKAADRHGAHPWLGDSRRVPQSLCSPRTPWGP